MATNEEAIYDPLTPFVGCFFSCAALTNKNWGLKQAWNIGLNCPIGSNRTNSLC